MPSCCVINCLHNSHGSFRLFRFPTDEERRKKWAINCGRINWFPTDYTRICEAHFAESQFEQNRQDGKKLLKWNAVPTLFNNSSRPRKTIKRHFRIKENSQDKILLETSNDREKKVDSSSGSPEALEDISKTTVKPTRSISQGKSIERIQFEEIDEIALIKAVLEKMGHEVHSENGYFELNQQDGNKLMKGSTAPLVLTKTKSSKRTLTVKRYPSKRRRLQEKTLPELSSEAAEGSQKAEERFGKDADKKQEDAEDLDDELAHIKAEIKKLMHEANVDDSSVFEVEQSGSQIPELNDAPTTCNEPSPLPKVSSVKKQLQKGISMEETTSKRSLINLPLPQTKTTVNGSCDGQELVGSSAVISEKSLQVEVGIQVENLKELEAVPRLKAEIGLLKHQLAEKDKKIHQLEQRLAAILQPGQIVLLQKFGSTLSGAKKYVVLGKQPNRTSAEKVS